MCLKKGKRSENKSVQILGNTGHPLLSFSRLRDEICFVCSFSYSLFTLLDFP